MLGVFSNFQTINEIKLLNCFKIIIFVNFTNSLNIKMFKE